MGRLMPSDAHGLPQPLIGWGEVLHTRVQPVVHRFRYPTWFLLLPMRRLRAQPAEALARNRRAWASFWDCDHGDGRDDALAWLESLLRAEGLAETDTDGEIWLHTYPRVLGYAFKPVSFWYVHRADGALRAVVAEVNNTFGERHCYLLTGSGADGDGCTTIPWGQALEARKVFHVSPFCRVEGRYRFRFWRGAARTVVRIEHDDAAGTPLLRTSVSGALQPLSVATLRQACWRSPWLTLGVIARIHWQALQLWWQRVPFFHKPLPPPVGVSR